MELSQFAVSSERLVWRDSRSKYSTVSSLRKAVFLKQGCESVVGFHTFCQGWNQRRTSGSVSVPPLCMCFVDPTVVCVQFGSLPGAVSTEAGALSLGGDHSAMNRIGKRRIGTGWMQVGSQTGSTVVWSLQPLAGAGVTRNCCWGHPRASPPGPLIRKKSMTLESCKARLHSRQQPACARKR